MQRSRIAVIATWIIALFLVLAGRLVWLQGIEWREHHERAETRRKAIRFLPAPRGRILDRHGAVIAVDTPVHELVYTLRGIDPAPLIAKRLAKLLESGAGAAPFDEETLKAAIKDLRRNFRPLLASGRAGRPHPWVTGLTPERSRSVAARVAARPEHFPGIAVEVREDGGRIVVIPEVIFAGELAVRRVAAALERDPAPWIARIDAEYRTTLEADVDRVQREYLFAGRQRVLVRDVPFELVVAISYHPERYPGLAVRERSRRRYPAGEPLAQLVGTAGPLTAVEFRRLLDDARLLDRSRRHVDDIRTFRVIRDKAYLSSDARGRSGLEIALEERLRGTVGARIIEVDGRGRPRGAALEEEAPLPGEDVRLTLDLELCRLLRELFLERAIGAGVALVGDPRSGALLGWCSHPSYHPDRLGEEWPRLKKMEVLAPFFNRPLRGQFPPGSTFKLVLALGALEERLVDPTAKILCEGRYDAGRYPNSFRCSNNPIGAELDLRHAIAHSCNVYFYRLGADVLGLEGIQRWAITFGFGHRTGLDVPDERAGTLPRSSPHSAGIGQGFEATPLQLFRFISGVANRGRLPTPRVLRSTPPSASTIPLRPETWSTVIEGMCLAVTEGTAHRESIGLRPFDVAVKTGTAQHGRSDRDDDDIGWIIGFAPVDDPRVAFVIGVEGTSLHGGDIAGPIAARILAWLESERGYALRRAP